MWVGIVTRIDSGFVYARVPDLDRQREYGPLEPLEGVVLAAGERLLLGELARPTGDLAIIRRLP